MGLPPEFSLHSREILGVPSKHSQGINPPSSQLVIFVKRERERWHPGVRLERVSRKLQICEGGKCSSGGNGSRRKCQEKFVKTSFLQSPCRPAPPPFQTNPQLSPNLKMIVLHWVIPFYHMNCLNHRIIWLSDTDIILTNYEAQSHVAWEARQQCNGDAMPCPDCYLMP